MKSSEPSATQQAQKDKSACKDATGGADAGRCASFEVIFRPKSLFAEQTVFLLWTRITHSNSPESAGSSSAEAISQPSIQRRDGFDSNWNANATVPRGTQMHAGSHQMNPHREKSEENKNKPQSDLKKLLLFSSKYSYILLTLTSVFKYLFISQQPSGFPVEASIWHHNSDCSSKCKPTKNSFD